MSKVTIRGKLNLVMFAIVLLPLVIGLMGAWAMSSINRNMASLYQDRLIPSVQIGEINALMRENRIRLLLAAQGGEGEQQLAPVVNEVGANVEQITALWKSYLATYITPDEKRLADEYAAARKQYVEQGLMPAKAALLAGNRAEAQRLLADAANPAYREAPELAKRLLQLQVMEGAREYAAAENLYHQLRWGLIGLNLLALGVAAFVAVYVKGALMRAMTDMHAMMESISVNKDMTQRLKAGGCDEIADCGRAFNRLIDAFREAITKVRVSAAGVRQNAAQMNMDSEQGSRLAEAQSDATASTAAAVEEITVSISSVGQSAEQLRERAAASLAHTREGGEGMEKLRAEIAEAETAVENIAAAAMEFVENATAITAMTSQVKDIADQTNLLALNAAIEAARAGDLGRGFAVVADEVRKLAEKSASSANAIDAITRGLAERSGQVREALDTGRQALSTGRAHVERVAELLDRARATVSLSTQGTDEISSSLRELTLAANEIARNVEQIAHGAERASASASDSHAAARRLDDLAAELEATVGQFSVGPTASCTA